MAGESSFVELPRATPRAKYWEFLWFNLFLAVFAFPCLLIAPLTLIVIFLRLVLVVSPDHEALLLSFYLTGLIGAHFTYFCRGLLRLERVRSLGICYVAIMLMLLLWNYKDPGMEDDRPLSGGVATVPQSVWGVTSYYRIFNEPLDPFGASYFDWPAFVLTFEFGILLTTFLAILVGIGLALWRWVLQLAMGTHQVTTN